MKHCPDRERLERLLHDLIVDTELEELDRHVQGCASCKQTLEELTDDPIWRVEPRNEVSSLLPEAESGLAIDSLGATVDATSDATTGATEGAPRGVPTVPGYEITGELGRGGMGVVYEARHVRLNRQCALKMILAGAHAGPDDVARFITEAEAIARLEHPSIVQIRHIGDVDGLPFLELEYLAGGGLDSQLDGTPWPANKAARLAEQLALGIAEAHRQGVVHRDLKPSNVLLAADGTPKVSDFGLAKMLDNQSALTQSESVMGSPSYMAPEQASGQGKKAGPAVDLYAAGAILYELLTGRPPFRGTTVLETLEQVKTTEPVPPSRLVPGVPRDIETICLKSLQTEPAKRYETAQALSEDLRRFLDSRPILARRTSRVERLGRWCRRNPVIATLVGVAALLLISTTGVSLAGYLWTSAALSGERAALSRERTALSGERVARREADGSLYHALVGEARALRTARGVGYRERVFGLIGRAARIDTPERDFAELRRESVASLGDFAGLEPLVLRDFGAPSRAVAIHPRSELIAVGLEDGSVCLFDRASGHERARLSGFMSQVSELTFDSQGRRLFVGHSDRTVRVVDDLASATPRVTETHKLGGTPYMLRWTSDGPVAVGRTGPIAGFAIDYPLEPAKSVIRFYLREAAPDGSRVMFATAQPVLALSPGGDKAAALVRVEGADGSARTLRIVLWDVAARRVLRSTTTTSVGDCLAFSPDGTLLAFGYDGGFSVLETVTLTAQMEVRLDSASGISFSPDGRILAVHTVTGDVQLWSMLTKRILAELKHPGQPWRSLVKFSDDGRTLASVRRNSVQAWDLAGAPERLELAGHALGVTGVAFSPDGSMVASSSKDGTAKIWDPATGRLNQTLRGYPQDVQTCQFSSDGALLATGSFAWARLRFWDTQSWQQASDTIDGDFGAIFSLSFAQPTDAGACLLAAAGQKGVRVWQVERAQGGRVVPRVVANHPASYPRSVAMSPDARWVAFNNEDSVAIWDVQTARLRACSGPKMLLQWHALTFRSDRELVYIAGSGAAVVWDVVADRLVKMIGQPGEFQSFHIAVSRDGRRLAAEATPTAVAIADLERGEVLYTFRQERSPIWSLALSPDAHRLAVGLSDGGLVVWDLHQVDQQLAKNGLKP